jgi:tetratricopeptide (TPR) repeat protein
MARAHKKTTSKTRDNNWLFYTTLWGLALILFYSPYFRGLFFRLEQQWTLLLTALVFLFCCFWKTSKKEISFLNHPLDYCVFALLLVYIVSCFFAADLRLAVAEVIKMALYFMVFWITSQIAVRDKVPRFILTVIYISGIGVALIGFLAAVGAVQIKDGFVGNRIFSTLQYPNALAIYLAAIVFFGFYLWFFSNEKLKLIITPGNFLLMMVFFAANSRGGFLVFPLMLLIFLVGLPENKRIPWFAHSIFVVILGLFISGRIIPAAVAGNNGWAWIWFFAGLIISVMAQWLGGKVLKKTEDKPLHKIMPAKKLIIVAVLLLVCFGALGNFWDSTDSVMSGDAQTKWYYKILPDHIATRVSDINLQTHNAQARIYWTLEAFNLIKNSPIIGMGGGAWEAAYQTFQNYHYSTTQVHNHFLQIWTEVGTLGFLIYLAIWVSFIVLAIKNYKTSSIEGKTMNLALFVSAVGLGIHSFIDFDLALSAVALVLWVSFGIVRGIARGKKDQFNYISSPKEGNKKSRFLVFMSALTLIFILLPGSLIMAEDRAREAVIFARQGNIDLAEFNLLTASKFDPFSGEYMANMASIKSTRGEYDTAVDYIQKAIARNPYNWGYYILWSDIEQQQGQWEKAEKASLKAKEYGPWILENYENLSKMYVSAGLDSLKKKDDNKARMYFNQCMGIPSMLKGKVENMPDVAKKLWNAEKRFEEKEFLELNSTLRLSMGICQYFLNHWEEAELSLQKALGDKNLEEETHFWLALLNFKRGDLKESEKHLQQVKDKKRLERFDDYKKLSIIDAN